MFNKIKALFGKGEPKMQEVDYRELLKSYRDNLIKAGLKRHEVATIENIDNVLMKKKVKLTLTLEDK